MNLVKAMLRQVDELKPGESSAAQGVSFTYNPERITVSHTLVMKQLDGQSGANLSTEEVVRRLGIKTIRIEGIHFYGSDTFRHCRQLLTWSEAVIKDPPSKTGSKEAVPIRLALSWGPQLHFDVHMETVVVAYTKFSSTTGTPVRALVNLTMHEYKPPTPAHNPTSGGPPGRRAHVLDSSECLPSLATAKYGRPSAWRDIARVNGIDDPLRVRPGRTLYLPNPDELARSKGARP